MLEAIRFDLAPQHFACLPNSLGTPALRLSTSTLRLSTQLSDAKDREQAMEKQMIMSQQMAIYSQRSLLQGMALGGAQTGADTVNILKTVNNEGLSVDLLCASTSSTASTALPGSDQARQLRLQ